MSQYFANTQVRPCPTPGAGVHVAVKTLPANNSRVERRTLPSHLCVHKHTITRTGFSAQLQLAATSHHRPSNQCAGPMVCIATAAHLIGGIVAL